MTDHFPLIHGNAMPMFVDEHGASYMFYIDPQEPAFPKYAKLISDHGGAVINTLTPEDENNHNVIRLSMIPDKTRTTYLFQFVDDLLRGGLQNLSKYEFAPQKRKVGGLGKLTKFTAEADAYILEQVRLKPRFRTLHKFFEELRSHPMLLGHTGNLIRSRYRAHLEHKLQYVYKTDEHDNLVVDEQGQRIPVPVTQVRTLKNKFTAEDDYRLCQNIIRHALLTQDQDHLRSTEGDYQWNENRFSVLISFFDDYAKLNPHHTSLSWRDRYRKFARTFGLQKYIAKYQSEVNLKDGAQPMSNLTQRKRNDKGEIVASDHKRLKPDPDSAVRALDAATSLHDHRHLIDLRLASDMFRGLMEADAAAAAVAAVAQHGVALDEEIGEVKNSNIHDALHTVRAGGDSVGIEDEMVSAIHPNLTGHGHDEFGEMEYLREDATLEDIFKPQFYEQDSKSVLLRVITLLSELGPEDTGKVLEAFERLGFTRRFYSHILRVTGAHAMYMNEYLTHVFLLIAAGDVSDTKDILYINGLDGFWTPELDDALMKGDFQALLHMSDDNIRIRRSFLGLDE